MPDAQPKPTAAWLLAEHAKCRWNGFQRPAARMTCGAPMPSAGPDFAAQHQEDMLAAAGLLATDEALAEHDAQVLRDAAEAWQYGGWADDMPKGTDRTALILGMAQRAATWLRARAARVAAGEEP